MQDMLKKIYENPFCLERKELHTLYSIIFGFPMIPDALPESKAMAAGIWNIQNTLFNSGYKKDLGWSDIGFEGVQIFCRAEVAHEANIYLQGLYDEILLLCKYKDLCRPGSTCIDVGANVGIHSIAMAKMLGENGNVLAFEPRQELIEFLHKNAEKNNVANIEVVQSAAYKEDTEISFNTKSACYNQGVGAIDLNASSKVSAKKLDSCFHGTDLSLIKIDVEGNEMDVLEGAGEILSTYKPKVIIEYAAPPWTITDLMGHFPYPVKITRIRNTQYESEIEVTQDTNLQGFNNLLVEEK